MLFSPRALITKLSIIAPCFAIFQCVFNVYSIYIQCLAMYSIFALVITPLLTDTHTPNLEMLSHLKISETFCNLLLVTWIFASCPTLKLIFCCLGSGMFLKFLAWGTHLLNTSLCFENLKLQENWWVNMSTDSGWADNIKGLILMNKQELRRLTPW